jgi:hypothetical protein
MPYYSLVMTVDIPIRLKPNKSELRDVILITSITLNTGPERSVKWYMHTATRLHKMSHPFTQLALHLR